MSFIHESPAYKAGQKAQIAYMRAVRIAQATFEEEQAKHTDEPMSFGAGLSAANVEHFLKEIQDPD